MTQKNEVDTKLLNTLDFLKSSNLAAYINLKKNAEAMCLMELHHDAERSFRKGDLRNYRCFCLCEWSNAEFAQYVGMKTCGDVLFYLHIRQDVEFALIIAVDRCGHVLERKYACPEKCIQDILTTFEDAFYEYDEAMLKAPFSGTELAAVNDNMKGSVQYA